MGNAQRRKKGKQKAPKGFNKVKGKGYDNIKSLYKFKETLGKGASCRVVAAVDKKDKKKRYAIKIIGKDRPVFRRLYEAENAVLSQLTNKTKEQHPNVITFYGGKEDQKYFYLITELCEGGELFDRIVTEDTEYMITEKTAAGYVKAMLEAIQFVHNHGIVHRDLKPENFVLQSDAVDAQLVLIDFGCAVILDPDEKTTYDTLVGTAYYMSPMLAILAMSRSDNARLADKYTPMVKPFTAETLKAADVWAIGVIAYVMLTGRAPFRGHTNDHIFRSTVRDPVQFPEKDARYRTPLQLSDAFKDFVNKVLVKDPSKRLTVDECMRHPWVQGIEAGDWQLNKDALAMLRQFNYQSKIKRAVVDMLAKSKIKVQATGVEDIDEEVAAHFTRLDADGDAFLNLEELEILLRDMGYAEAIAKQEAAVMMQEADVNHDGQLNFSEFKKLWHRKMLNDNESYVHKVFDVFDLNGDGFIDLEELKVALVSEPTPEAVGGGDAADEKGGDEQPADDEKLDEMGPSNEEEFARLFSMIKEVDRDKDKRVSFAEFNAAMMEGFEQGAMRYDSLTTGAQVTDFMELHGPSGGTEE